MTWLGLDIGGANLKAADGLGRALCKPFPLWQKPDALAEALVELAAQFPDSTRLAITMTGELCDCFRTKADGVRHILAAAERMAAGCEARVYLVSGELVPIEQASETPHLTAASNWHALARFVCRYVPEGGGVLMDVGSTTTDIVPLADGRPCPCGLNDTARLIAGELVYTGVGRTPICAVTRWLPWRGGRCPVAAELFATTADAYVVLADVPEQADGCSTADGRPLTTPFARERLARMVCADAKTFTEDDAYRAAEAVRDAQAAQISAALAQVISKVHTPIDSVILCGAGEFLARRIVNCDLPKCHVTSLSDQLGGAVSACAAAHAVAVLAREAKGQ